MKILTTLVIATVVAVIGVVGFAYSGIYDVSASSPHGGVVNWLLSTTSHASIERRAEVISVPNLDNDVLLRAGVNDFSAMCAGCHGAPGQPRESMGKGLTPPPPDLAESAERMTPAELFWVTKHGIKMSGMPAWGATHEDEALWPVVALLTILPNLDAAGYQALLEGSEGDGHHTSGHGDDHSAPATESEPEETHDDSVADPSIVAIIKAIEQGWEKADGIPFRQHFLDIDGTRYIEGGSQNKGLVDLIEHHVEPEGDALENFDLTLSNTETHVEGEFAWAIADVELVATTKKDNKRLHLRGYETFLFRSVDGAWKVVHTHSSSRPVDTKQKEHKH